MFLWRQVIIAFSEYMLAFAKTNNYCRSANDLVVSRRGVISAEGVIETVNVAEE